MFTNTTFDFNDVLVHVENDNKVVNECYMNRIVKCYQKAIAS